YWDLSSTSPTAATIALWRGSVRRPMVSTRCRLQDLDLLRCTRRYTGAVGKRHPPLRLSQIPPRFALPPLSKGGRGDFTGCHGQPLSASCGGETCAAEYFPTVSCLSERLT